MASPQVVSLPASVQLFVPVAGTCVPRSMNTASAGTPASRRSLTLPVGAPAPLPSKHVSSGGSSALTVPAFVSLPAPSR